MDASNLNEAKRRIRTEALAERKALSPDVVQQREARFADLLVRVATERGARVVTAYASVGNEPPTRLALERLRARGVRVLLPVVLPDLDLDWAEYTPGDWQDSRMGLVEPTSDRLGLEAIAQADVIFCPGVAATPDGRRLGRGGGCYDRALTRARPDATRCLVLYEENVLAEVPTSERDQLVDLIVTPTGVLDTHARWPTEAG